MHGLVTSCFSHRVYFSDTDMAPFDAYSLSFFVFVIDEVTNEPIPIITFAVGEAPNNFELSSVEVETMSSYTYNSETGPTTIDVGSKVIRIKAKRTRFAQTLTMCLFLVNWALTAASIHIVLVLFRKEGINDAVLLLPITIILTIPTLRSLYPGPLPFGILIGESRAPRSYFKH